MTQQQRESRWSLSSTGNRVVLAIVIGLIGGRFLAGDAPTIWDAAYEQDAYKYKLIGSMVVVAAVVYALLTLLKRR